MPWLGRAAGNRDERPSDPDKVPLPGPRANAGDDLGTVEDTEDYICLGLGGKAFGGFEKRAEFWLDLAAIALERRVYGGHDLIWIVANHKNFVQARGQPSRFVATRSSSRQRISYIKVAPVRAVTWAWLKGGGTWTKSTSTKSSPRRPRRIRCRLLVGEATNFGNAGAGRMDRIEGIYIKR